MRYRYLIICMATTALLVGSAIAQTNNHMRVALIADKAFDLHKSPLVSLLEVKLSQGKGVQLLERTQIDKILQEQQLSVAGFLERDTAVKVGRLLRADAFLLLSIEDGENNKQDKNKLLRVRFVETTHGLRIWDSFEQSDVAKLEEITQRITKKVDTVADKLTLSAGQAIPVGIVDVHSVQLGERYRWLTRVLPGMLSVRLSKEPWIIMLEREDLKILRREKLLTEGEDTEFWNSAVLIDGYLQPRGRKDIEMTLRLRRASGDDIAVFTVLVEPNEPLTAVGKAASDIIRELLNAPPATQWQPRQESGEFFRQGQLLYEHARYENAIAPLETAHALQPGNVFYTGALFSNEWALRFRKGGSFHTEGTGISHYSDLELAELVSLLVRQIRDGYEKSSLSVRDIYYRWARPSGPLSIGGLSSPASYFTNPVSVSTEQIRMINRENRKIWVETMDKALRQQLLREDAPRMNTLIRARLAWVSSDDPEQLMANLKKAFVEFVMPPELGGKIESPQEREHLFYQAFQAELRVHSISYLDYTHLKGSSDKFLKLWREYLKELSKFNDPVVSIKSGLALASGAVGLRDKTERAEAENYGSKTLEAILKKLKNLNESNGDNEKKQLLSQVRSAMAAIRLQTNTNEQIGFWEEICEPLIEQKDIDNLTMLDPGWRPFSFSPHRYQQSVLESIERYYHLLERIAVILQTRKSDKQVAKAHNNIRDFQAEIRKKFPQIDFARKQTSLPIIMLLTKKDWLSKRYGCSMEIECKENMLWVALRFGGNTGNPNEDGNFSWASDVGLAGINLEQKKLVTLWQAEISFPNATRLTGLVVSDRESYLCIKDGGLVEFPGSATEGREFLKNPKILTQKHSLPSLLITSIAQEGDKLWVAYGDKGQESGLGLYDPKTQTWETVFCSTLKGETPFNAGRPYEVYSLTFVPPDQLFFLAYDLENSGLWKIDSNTREVKYLGPIWTTSHPNFARIEYIGNQLWLKKTSYLINYNSHSESMKFLFGDPEWLIKRYSDKYFPLNLEWDIFYPESYLEKVKFGSWRTGFFDLLTATIHNDQLWARLGQSQIIIIENDKSFEESQIIDNNILDGEPVSRFLSTPYGLVAIGNGTVGLIETKNIQ